MENYERVLKFSGNWRDHGVPLIKWALVVRWKLSYTEGEKDDSEAKVSNCQCKHLEYFDKFWWGGVCHKGGQVHFLLDESVYVGTDAGMLAEWMERIRRLSNRKGRRDVGNFK